MSKTRTHTGTGIGVSRWVRTVATTLLVVAAAALVVPLLGAGAAGAAVGPVRDPYTMTQEEMNLHINRFVTTNAMHPRGYDVECFGVVNQSRQLVYREVKVPYPPQFNFTPAGYRTGMTTVLWQWQSPGRWVPYRLASSDQVVGYTEQGVLGVSFTITNWNTPPTFSNLPPAAYAVSYVADWVNAKTGKLEFRRHFPVMGYYAKIGFNYYGSPVTPTGPNIADSFPELFGQVNYPTVEGYPAAALNTSYCDLRQ